MDNNNKPVVSFCIPVYNNAEAAVKIVHDLLVSERQDFEVIVSDDASSDNVQELLAQVNDSRFKYYRNEKNLGAHQNWLHSLELGQGKWLYLIMGRDKLHGEYIGKLISLLNKANEYNITYFEDGYTPEEEWHLYNGFEAIAQFVRVWHPTGAVFNQELFDAIPDKKYLFTLSDMYPENYLRLELLMKGSGAAITSGVYHWGEFVIDFTKIRSTIDSDKTIDKVFYSPKRRTKQVLELIDIIMNYSDSERSERKFTNSEINLFLDTCFTDLSYRVSLEWRDANKYPSVYKHYDQNPRFVGRLEMLRNIFNAYRDTKAYLKSHGLYSLSRELIMWKGIMRTLLIPFKCRAKTLWEKIKTFPHSN